MGIIMPTIIQQNSKYLSLIFSSFIINNTLDGKSRSINTLIFSII